MKELFRANLYLADSDSVISQNSNENYIVKFKSSLLLAKSIGMNPNMIIDSLGFEKVCQDDNIKKFLIRRINQSKEEEGPKYSIKVHIFNNFIEKNYFDCNKTDNPFQRYYEKMIEDPYHFSSYGLKKNELEKNSEHKKRKNERLEVLYKFGHEIYHKTGSNIFEIHNHDSNKLRDLIIDRINFTQKEIKKDEYLSSENSTKEYLNLLKEFIDMIKYNQNILNRSHFYDLLKEDNIKKGFSENIINKVKKDIIDISYSSSFIKEGEIYRYKSIPKLDTFLARIFNMYTEKEFVFQLENLYKEFKNLKSKIEIIDLMVHPTKMCNYLLNELMNTTQDKGINILHTYASRIISRTKVMGIADSENLVIGMK
ncbi:hypothetical protein [Sulfurospirillum sp. 1612]|uniref:hypothetical protein n=1 Tax=Sulfurospirillum sp. 1612 TaxID=3094835 RepID=UPI002F93A8BB